MKTGEWLFNTTLRFSHDAGYGKLHPRTIHLLIRYTAYNYDKIISLYTGS
jgi:hypothetical protein